MIRMRPLGWVFACLALLALGAGAAFADEAEATEAGKGGGAIEALAFLALYVLLWLGIGAAMALLRVIVPRIADAADASVRRLSTVRLLVGGLLPLIGAYLLGAAVDVIDNPVIAFVYMLVVAIPLALAVLAGAMAALPRIGAKLLKDGESQGMLKRCFIGGLVLGLAGVTVVLPPLAGFLGFVVAGWFVGIGVGTVVRPRAPAIVVEPVED